MRQLEIPTLEAIEKELDELHPAWRHEGYSHLSYTDRIRFLLMARKRYLHPLWKHRPDVCIHERKIVGREHLYLLRAL